MGFTTMHMQARLRLIHLIAVLAVTGAGCGDDDTPAKANDAGAADSGKASGATAGKSSGSGDKAGSGAAAGSGGSKSSSSSSAGTGGSSGSKAGSAGSTQSGSTNLPSDGNQLSLCTMAQGDCNKGLACYAPANAFSTGRGFCSKLCTMDSDCDGLTPTSSKYTCQAGNGTRVCELVCSGTDDTSCPSNMQCVQTAAASGGGPGPTAGSGGSGGSGGRAASFRCKYPLETSQAFGPCDDAIHACAEGLVCNVSGGMRSGFCSKDCEMDSDCSDKPSSGSITPTCAMITAARGNTKAVKRCVLSCLDAKDGCPQGQMCIDGPMGMNMMPSYARCGY
jgi:hypothetical protein